MESRFIVKQKIDRLHQTSGCLVPSTQDNSKIKYPLRRLATILGVRLAMYRLLYPSA